MAQLMMSKGITRTLPTGSVYNAGLGWDPADGAEIDLDLWVIRRNGGIYEVIAWANQDWQRPDLGSNSQGQPFIATPEGDVVYKGDDRKGTEAGSGYDETSIIDMSKAPAGVDQYQLYASIWDENETGCVMGWATNITCGVKEENSGHELVVKLEDEHGFDVSVLLCTIDRGADGTWTMTNPDTVKGFTDDMITVAHALGVA